MLRKHRDKLNPKKYVFSIVIDKLFRFIVFEKEIKANQEKIKAMMDMQPPSSIKVV